MDAEKEVCSLEKRDEEAASTSSLGSSSDEAQSGTRHEAAGGNTKITSRSKRRRLGQIICQAVAWSPPWCRWNPEKPAKFSMKLNLLLALASSFTVANLYYSHPILNVLAHDFGVEYEKVSQIPTLAQVGYAIGLAFLCPLGDILRRRPLILVMVFTTSTLWIGLCVTDNFVAFEVITMLSAITNVTVQIIPPIIGDMAPPERRAMALSIVTSGNLLGIMIARILSGAVANYTGWRTVYWIAFGMQYLILILLFLFMPDIPPANPTSMSYPKILWTMVKIFCRNPLLVQACVIAVATSAPFTSYWTVLTFLLSGAPYHYSSLVIGLWALIGIAGICTTPVIARFIIDRYVPIFSTILGECAALVGIIIGTYTGLISTAGVGLQAFLLDIGLQVSQIANRASIYSVEPQHKSKTNTLYMVFTFLGQITGTAAGNRLYAQGGWIASGSLSVGMVCFALLVCFARGPWEEGWVGWHGGWNINKETPKPADMEQANTINHLDMEANVLKSGLHEKSPTTPDDAAVKNLTNTEKGSEELAAEDEDSGASDNPLKTERRNSQYDV